MKPRRVFFVSDQTGVTVETLGQSLLEQFEGVEFETSTVPFIDSIDKARHLAAQITSFAERDGQSPIVFASLVQNEARAELAGCDALVLDFFDAFLAPLEAEIGSESSHSLRRSHGIYDSQGYNLRIEATNFAMVADDGHATHHYDQADVILLGVSRSGKTPTCLYLALQYGIFAANYPLNEDDLELSRLPESVKGHRSKLYGLTIAPDRLRQIRLERRSGGRYATPQQVGFELRAAEALFRKLAIPFIDTTHSSIEEIASTILSQAGLVRRVRA